MEVFIELGAPMKDFLTVRMLHRLYNWADRPDTLVHCLQSFDLPTHIKTDNQKATHHALENLTANVLSGFQDIHEIEIGKNYEMSQAWVSLKTIKRLLKRMLGSFYSRLYDDVNVSALTV